eukprot:10475625-Ditylum_brightwellii.AAC.1
MTQGPASYAVAKTLLKGNALTCPTFDQCINDVAKHVFPEKAGQIQKQYMQRIFFGKDLTVKE